MPTLTRWYLKSALAWLLVSGLIGGLTAIRAWTGWPAVVGVMQPMYFHALMVGWVTQLIFGVTYWMFPKVPPNAAPRAERLGWCTWVALNLGLLMRAIGEPAAALDPAGRAGLLLALSALLQLAAGYLYVMTTWPRVRGH